MTDYTNDQILELQNLMMEEIDDDFPIDDIAPRMLAAYAKAGGPNMFVMELVIRPAKAGEETEEDPRVDGTTVTQVAIADEIYDLLSDKDD